MRLAALLLCALPCAPAFAADDSPVIAAAANLTHPVTQIVERFESAGGSRLRLSFGSSGDFTRQIRQGAPYQLFLSADRRFVDALAADRLTLAPGIPFATGRVGAFVPSGSALIAAPDLKDLVSLLAGGKYRRIALANPELAPYGAAAREALQHAGIWAIERDRIVMAENVAQAMQFTLSGNVDAGFVAWSFALLPGNRDKGKFFLFPEEWHAPLVQWSVLLVGAGDDARRFQEFLGSAEARRLLEQSGYTVPGP